MEKLEKTGSKVPGKIHEFIEYDAKGKAVVLMSNVGASERDQAPKAPPAKPAASLQGMGSLRLFANFETMRIGLLPKTSAA